MAGLYHGWDGDEDTHADFVHGGVDEDDFVDTIRYRKKAVKKNKRAKGCPENNGGPHVYVWIPFDTWWSGGAYEIKVCCGCEHRAPRRSFRGRA